MADIKLNDLSDRNSFGADLFDDPENFMVELSDDDDAIGGFKTINIPSCASYGHGCTERPPAECNIGTCGISQVMTSSEYCF